MRIRQPSSVVDAPDVVQADACEKMSAPLTAVTWNVALAPGMNPLYTPRVMPVIDTIKRMRYDVLCIQEAWLDKDKRAIIAASGLPPENVFMHDTAGLAEDESDTCSGTELELVLACTQVSCVGRSTEDTTICAMEHCGDELKLVYAHNPRCVNCLAAMVGQSADDIVRSCSSSSKSASRIYGGANGLILLSRWPLHDKEVMMLPSSHVNRPVLFARVNVPGASEPIEVACTHLSSPQRIPPSQSGYSTWEEEQQAQLRVIVDGLGMYGKGRPQLLLGDMNFSPANGTTLRAYSIAAWNDAVADGFIDPPARADPPFCSVCGENTVRGAPGDVGLLFDHVFYRDPNDGVTLEPMCADRLNDTLVVVTDHRGRRVVTNLSDHYAVRVKFGFK